jgi:hypothetical protein
VAGERLKRGRILVQTGCLFHFEPEYGFFPLAMEDAAEINGLDFLFCNLPACATI